MSSSTYANRLAGSDGRDHRKYFEIDGVDGAFQEDVASVPAALVSGGRTSTRYRSIRSVTQGRRELDVIRRRQTGGDFRAVLVDDDADTLAALFSARKRRACFVTAAHTAAAVTINVSSTGNLDAPGTVWIGAEAITYTGITATTLTGCTRGAFGSTARPLVGGTHNGQAVYSSPPSWVGRKLTLSGYFLGYNGAAPSAAMKSVLGTFEIDSAPKYLGDRQWEVTAIDRLSAFLAKPTYLGVRRISQTEYPATYGEDRSAIWGAPDLLPALFGITDVTAAAAAAPLSFSNVLVVAEKKDHPSYWTFMKVTTITTISQNPDGSFSQALVTTQDMGMTSPPGTVDEFSELIPAAYLNGSASSVALGFLTSRLGDGANGADDVLPGLDRTTIDGLAWRMGAGILRADVDTASFASVGAGASMWYFLERPRTAEDVVSQFCFLTDSFVHSNSSGQLSVKSFDDSLAADAVVAVVDASIEDGSASVEYDEGGIYPTVILRTNWNRTSDAFDETIDVHDSEIAERYPTKVDALTIEARSVRLLPGYHVTAFTAPGVHVVDMEAKLRRYQSEDAGKGALFVETVTDLVGTSLELGDRVTLTVSDAPDFEGGSLSSVRARVEAVEPLWDDGRCKLRLRVLREPVLISPAATVSAHSLSGGNRVLTLDAASFFGPADGKPGRMFSTATPVFVWDVSANTSTLMSVFATADGSITLVGDVGFALQDGVDFVTLADANDEGAFTGGFTTDHGYNTASDFAWQVRDDEADTASADAIHNSRWR